MRITRRRLSYLIREALSYGKKKQEPTTNMLRVFFNSAPQGMDLARSGAKGIDPETSGIMTELYDIAVDFLARSEEYLTSYQDYLNVLRPIEKELDRMRSSGESPHSIPPGDTKPEQWQKLIDQLPQSPKEVDDDGLGWDAPEHNYTELKRLPADWTRAHNAMWDQFKAGKLVKGSMEGGSLSWDASGDVGSELMAGLARVDALFERAAESVLTLDYDNDRYAPTPSQSGPLMKGVGASFRHINALLDEREQRVESFREWVE